VFATRQECDAARAIKIAELDAKGWRFPHQRPDAPMRTTTLPNGTVIQEQVPSTERNDVTYCEPGGYSPGSTPNIAKGKNEDTLPTRIALPVVQQDTTLEVAPGFVKHWVSLRPFTRVIPGTSEVIEVLSASGRELVFMVKPDIDLPPTTNILLVDDNGEVIANLKIVIPSERNWELRQGPDGTRVYHKDNPNYVAPKRKENK
jgi:hypothetical protein